MEIYVVQPGDDVDAMDNKDDGIIPESKVLQPRKEKELEDTVRAADLEWVARCRDYKDRTRDTAYPGFYRKKC